MSKKPSGMSDFEWLRRKLENKRAARSRAAKRMDRPHKIAAANRGYDKVHNLIHRGIVVVISQITR